MAASVGGEKLQVLWSPNVDNHFATYGSELRVYNFDQLANQDQTLSKTDLKLSSRHCGKLIGVSSEVTCSPNYQTVAWQPSKTHSHFFAVGQTNGKVSLVNLLSKEPGLSSSHGFQLGPKALGRPCNCVAWNPNDTRLLAEGLEKTRSDSSLIVWDITRASSTGGRTRTSDTVSASSDDRSKFFETGHGENTSSLAWLQENTLVAGMGSRYLKIFDIREETHGVLQTSGTPREYAQHKAIYGLCVDPTSPYQLATYAEGNTVYLWDTRYFQRPMYSFQRGGNVMQLSWLTTRPGCLSAVFTEAPYLRLINIPFLSQSSDATCSDSFMEYFNSHITDRCPLTSKEEWKKSSVSSLQWHSTWVNTGLIINNQGQVREIKVCDKSPITWSSRNSLLYGASEQIFTCNSNLDDDVSVIMRQRIDNGYGFNIGKNLEVTPSDPTLHSVWSWLNSIVGQVSSSSDSKKRIHGVSDVLEGLSNSSQVPPIPDAPPFSTFTSTERANALDLCGWGFSNQKDTLDGFLKREEILERFERAAAIAVFQGNIIMANISLREGAVSANSKGQKLQGSLLNLIALSLSGYRPSESALWMQTCIDIRSQISHPYLRALFTFLCSGGDFKPILDDSEVMLQDRVAFACTYLNDHQLKQYITNLKSKVISNGQIEGVFLTGLSDDGISLIANYVNMTGDTQTACFIAGQVLPTVGRDPTVIAWFEGYRDLLDQWKLWKERAHFDHQRKVLDPSHKLVKSTVILCSFCSKAISSDVLRQDRLKATAKKSTSCPNCRKPLPRCALCLLHMVAGNSKGKDPGSMNLSDQFGQWFTWCQTCRHGGHAVHMTEWFDTHRVCPVTDCSCYCMSLDVLER